MRRGRRAARGLRALRATLCVAALAWAGASRPLASQDRQWVERRPRVDCDDGPPDWLVHGSRGQVAVLGRLLPGFVAHVRTRADTGRFAVDSARLVAVEAWAADAPALAREIVRRDGGRLAVVRQRPPVPCTSTVEWERMRWARQFTPPDDTTAVFIVRLRIDTVDARPRALAYVAYDERLAYRPRAVPRARDERSYARLDSLSPTPARRLEWWDVSRRLAPPPTREGEQSGSDLALARRVVAWSERHRDSAAADPVVGVVRSARTLLQRDYLRTIATPLAGRWEATVVDASGGRHRFEVDASLARDEMDVPATAWPSVHPDSVFRVGTLRFIEQDDRPLRTATDELGPPGWTAPSSVHALRLRVVERRPGCTDAPQDGDPPACQERVGVMEHEVRPLHADADSVVYAVGMDFGGLRVFAQRSFEASKVVFDALEPGDAFALLHEQRRVDEAAIPGALFPEARQGRCVIVRRDAAAHCRFRGRASTGEILEYHVHRPPTAPPR